MVEGGRVEWRVVASFEIGHLLHPIRCSYVCVVGWKEERYVQA